MHTNWIYLRVVTTQYIILALNHRSLFLNNIDKTEELTELTGMTSVDRNDKCWQSWQVLTGMKSVDRADRYWRSWQVLMELTSIHRLDRYWRSWQVLMELTSIHRLDRYWLNRSYWQIWTGLADLCWQRLSLNDLLMKELIINNSLRYDKLSDLFLY